MARPLASVCLGLTLSACVTQAEHDALKKDLADARGELTRVSTERDEAQHFLDAQHAEANRYQHSRADLQRRIDALQVELETTRAQREKLQGDLADALASGSALEESIAEMRQALDEAAARELAAKARVAEFRQLLRRLKTLIDAGKIKIQIRDGRMVLELPTDILFGSGSAELSDEGRAALTEVGRVLAQMPDRSFQVEGHTDDVPIKTARFPSNWELGAARSLSVLQTLMEAGVAPRQISAATYGEHQPTANNSSDDGRRANRRIEIVLVPDLAQLPGVEELKRAAGGS